jgi:hypothetical protein
MSDQRFFNHRDKPLPPNRQRVAVTDDPPRKQPTEQRGADPYNTSGSFDRKNNWARVGKR